MSLTKQRSNIPGASRGIDLSTWGPLVNRLSKLAIEYAQSRKSSSLGNNSVGSFPVSNQYTATPRRSRNKPSGGGTRRGNSSQFSERSGIPRSPIVKVHQIVIKGSHMVQFNNGSQSRRWYIGNSVDVADILQTSTSAHDLALVKTYSCWKIHRVDLDFVPCLAATDGGYHVGVVSNAVNTLASNAITPFEISKLPGSKMLSVRENMRFTLAPTHHDGVVHYSETANSDETDETIVGSVLYYIAGGSATSFQPACIMNYTLYMTLWS